LLVFSWFSWVVYLLEDLKYRAFWKKGFSDNKGGYMGREEGKEIREGKKGRKGERGWERDGKKWEMVFMY
jgi:hypothetical protein